MRFKEGDKVYIVENGLRVTLVQVMRAAGTLYNISLGIGKAIRLPKEKLCATAAEAEKHAHRIVKAVPERRDPHEWEYKNYYRQYKGR